MTRVKHREENSPNTRRGPGGRTSPGDIIDVSDEIAEKLLSKPYFELVSDDEAESEDESETKEVDNGETNDSDTEAGDEFDAESWLDQDYDERADRVRSGDVDDHLGEIDEAETSNTVRDAIGERRAELME